MSTAKWTTPSTYSAGNLADNAGLASKAVAAAFNAQVGGSDTVVDNTTGLALYMDIELVLGAPAGNWAVTDYVPVYLLPSLDGTNYAYGTGTLPPPANYLAANLPVTTTAEATARRLVARGIVIPPGKFKISLQNKTSQTWAASGNTLSYVTYGEQAV